MPYSISLMTFFSLASIDSSEMSMAGLAFVSSSCPFLGLLARSERERGRRDCEIRFQAQCIWVIIIFPTALPPPRKMGLAVRK